MVLLQQLLDMFRCRTAGTGFEQATASQQRYDRKHLCTGAELEDREQVGEVVTQHVAGDGDGVLPCLYSLQRITDGFDRRHDPDLQAGGIVILEVLFHLGDQVGVMGTVLVQPEDRRLTGETRTVDGEFYPVLDRQVLGLTHAPDITDFDLVFEQRIAGSIGDSHGAGLRDLECLVV